MKLFEPLFFLGVLLLLLVLSQHKAFALEHTECQQQGNYIDCTTTEDYDLGKHKDTECQRQGSYTDCNTTFNNMENKDE